MNVTNQSETYWMDIGAFKGASHEILQFHKVSLCDRTAYVMYGVATTPTTEQPRKLHWLLSGRRTCDTCAAATSTDRVVITLTIVHEMLRWTSASERRPRAADEPGQAGQRTPTYVVRYRARPPAPIRHSQDVTSSRLPRLVAGVRLRQRNSALDSLRPSCPRTHHGRGANHASTRTYRLVSESLDRGGRR